MTTALRKGDLAAASSQPKKQMRLMSQSAIKDTLSGIVWGRLWHSLALPEAFTDASTAFAPYLDCSCLHNDSE